MYQKHDIASWCMLLVAILVLFFFVLVDIYTNFKLKNDDNTIANVDISISLCSTTLDQHQE
jgi:hypothetical protein